MALETLYEIIKYEITHPDYERTVKLADDYFAFYTGVGLDEKLERIVRREDKEMFEQRKKLTQHIIPPLNNSLKVPFAKVPRSQGVHAELITGSGYEETTADFWLNNNVRHYFDTRYIDLSWIDPNAWLFIENDATDGSKYPPVYAYEIPSVNAYNYQYADGSLQFLVVRETKQKKVIVKDELKTVDYLRWTIYTKEETIVLNEDITIEQAGDSPTPYMRGELEYVDIDEVAYQLTRVIRPPYEFIPADRIGYIHDNVTQGRTFESPMHPALPYYNKLLKAVSELDLTSSLHNFPQKVESVNKCTAMGCTNGLLHDGSLCEVCKGTGYQLTHTSAQDVVRVALPNLMNGEQQLSLDDVVRYIYLPSEAMTMQIEYIEDLKQAAYRAIYNSELFSKAEVSETATAKNLDMQSVYDTLYPFALNYVESQAFVYEAIQEITGIDVEFTATIEKDFKLKSYEDLLYELKLAKDSGASADIIEKINDNIAEAFYQDDEYLKAKYQTQKNFDPFSAKTPEQVMSIITTLPIHDPDRVAWTFKEAFFDQLEREVFDYYLLNDGKKWELFRQKVEEKAAALKSNTPEPVNFA